MYTECNAPFIMAPLKPPYSTQCLWGLSWIIIKTGARYVQNAFDARGWDISRIIHNDRTWYVLEPIGRASTCSVVVHTTDGRMIHNACHVPEGVQIYGINPATIAVLDERARQNIQTRRSDTPRLVCFKTTDIMFAEDTSLYATKVYVTWPLPDEVLTHIPEHYPLYTRWLYDSLTFMFEHDV